MTKPKILFFDVETKPILGYTWAKWETDVLAIKEDWELLSFAYKWQGDRGVKCLSAEGKKDDKHLVIELHKLFQEADILVAHNGNSFDIKKTKARMLYHGLPPTKIATSVDTKLVAKAHFNFSGNSLNDLGTFLKLGQKAKHTGFDMWLGCMRGDKKAWKQMRHYNKKDVILLERVYDKFLPWIESHPNVARLLNPLQKALGVCPTCTSKHVKRQGYRATASSVRQQWQCNACGRWFLTALVKPGTSKLK